MTDLPESACEDFCQELSGADDTTFSRVYKGQPASRIIATSPNLTLMADLSPLCEGHLLLVSNHHYYSYAAVCRDHRNEVARITAQILKSYKSTFGDVVVLEHGSTVNTTGSSCITHAHWHFLPVDPSRVVARMEADGLRYTAVNDFTELVAYSQAPYYYVAAEEDLRVFQADQAMKQQYLRSIIAEILGIPDPEWDWALIIRKSLLRDTMKATADWHIT